MVEKCITERSGTVSQIRFVIGRVTYIQKKFIIVLSSLKYSK